VSESSGQISGAVSASRGQDSLVSDAVKKADKSATRGFKNRSRVAKKSAVNLATRGHGAEVVDLATERRNRLKTQQHSLATRGQKTLRKNISHAGHRTAYIEAVKASKGTWAFRLRERIDGVRRPPIYISRVADSIYEMIRGGDYETFKQQLISSHSAGAVRASH
jgi:hypothetical protein